jgi:outer membrane murein-binding lipoprotein Lpp
VRTRRLALLAIPVAVVLLAGCSSDKKTTSAASNTSSASSAQTSSGTDLASLSADQLLAKSGEALKAADQIHIKGTTSDQGQEVAIDYSFAKTNSSGSITLSGEKIELIAIDKIVYFRAPDTFWKQFSGANAAAVLKVVSGKWIKVAAGDKNFEDFSSLADRAAFIKDFVTPEGTPKLATPKTVKGVDCLAISDSKGSTLYVAKDDARPIQISGQSASEGGMDISYDGVTEPTAPAAADVIDSGKLGA